jgi:hypothetical protein
MYAWNNNLNLIPHPSTYSVTEGTAFNNGTSVKVWKQDPAVVEAGIRKVYLPSRVKTGPKDNMVAIVGMPNPVQPDANGDFLLDPKRNELEFDAVHTFSVVRMVVNMFSRYNGKEFKWQWGNGAIKVDPRAGLTANAYYSRSERALRFFYFKPQNSQNMVYTCRSFDIVAHEAGHAYLDALKPSWWGYDGQTGAFHESFGDLTSILLMLSQLDVCDTIIAETKGDLHSESFFNNLADEFGVALGRQGGLRNADNDLKLSEVENEVHDLSQVFTGAFYDILVDCYNNYRDDSLYDPAETLFRTGKQMRALLMQGIINSGNGEITFKEIATNMIAYAKSENWDHTWVDSIIKHFDRREIILEAQAKGVKKGWQNTSQLHKKVKKENAA